MTKKQVDALADRYEDPMLRMDGFDDCCVGVIERFGMKPILCYSIQKVIRNLVRGGMSEEEAYEYFEFNQMGAWMGEGTPCFLNTGKEAI